MRDFSIRVMRGDRIGLIGPNGSGKTTFLKLLLGELEPAAGEIRRGANVEVAYYDQQREQLDPDRSVVDTIGDGNDTVTVNGRPRHVHGYLQDFLFSPERARSPVSALSGGERNRLLLARLFTRPANVLVLDEPTNDLDLETLELLEQQLVEWPGTLLAGQPRSPVSRQRRHQHRCVRRRRPAAGIRGRLRGLAASAASAGTAEAPRPRPKPREAPAKTKTKRTFKEEREYAELPDRIAALEAEQQQLQAAIADPEFYKKPAADIHAALERVTAIEAELHAALERWDALDSIGKSLSLADRFDLIPLLVGHRLHRQPRDAHQRHVGEALVGLDLGERHRPLERLARGELDHHQAPALSFGSGYAITDTVAVPTIAFSLPVW